MKNNIEKKISYESEKPSILKEVVESFKKGKRKGEQVARTTKEELMYYLSPVYSKDQIKDLDEDQLMELLDEVIDRVYKVNMKRGGIIKDPSFNIYNSGGPVKPTQFMELQNILNAMSEEERKNLQFMLNQLLEDKK